MAMMPPARGIAERRQLGLLDRALARAHDDEVRRRRTPGPASIAAIFSPASICTRLAIALPRPSGPTSGNLVDLEPVGAAAIGEHHHVGVRRRDEEMVDDVLVARAHADAALAAALLVAIRRDRRALDVARVGDRDRDVLVGDQILDAAARRSASRIIGAAIVAELASARRAARRRRSRSSSRSLARISRRLAISFMQLGELVENLLPLEAGQPLQLHVENRLRLDLAQAELRDQAGLALRAGSSTRGSA